MIIVDSHCHLDMLEQHHSLDEVIERARKNNVKYLQTISVKLEDFSKIIAIAEKYDNVYASVGVHPNEVKEPITSSQELLKLAEHPKVIGIGETGLDYYRTTDTKQKQLQQDSFAEHIRASQENQLPVIIHTRDAEQDSASIIKEHMLASPFPALIHCFTASKEFARQMLDLGLYISISGIVTFKNATELQEIVKYIPSERLLVETDSPYLAPTPHRGKVNEPAYTLHVLEYIAKLKNISPEELAAIILKNFNRLFSCQW